MIKGKLRTVMFRRRELQVSRAEAVLAWQSHTKAQRQDHLLRAFVSSCAISSGSNFSWLNTQRYRLSDPVAREGADSLARKMSLLPRFGMLWLPNFAAPLQAPERYKLPLLSDTIV